MLKKADVIEYLKQATVQDLQEHYQEIVEVIKKRSTRWEDRPPPPKSKRGIGSL
jgi:hypothetical protein